MKEGRLCIVCGQTIPEEDNHDKCRTCRRKRTIRVIKGIVLSMCAVAAGIVIYNLFSADNYNNDEDDFNEDTVGEIPKEIEDSVPDPKRYSVQFKRFKDGEWYEKTATDYPGPAASVAYCNSYGRAYRVIDNVTGDIILEATEEDLGTEECYRNHHACYTNY